MIILKFITFDTLFSTYHEKDSGKTAKKSFQWCLFISVFFSLSLSHFLYKLKSICKREKEMREKRKWLNERENGNFQGWGLERVGVNVNILMLLSSRALFIYAFTWQVENTSGRFFTIFLSQSFFFSLSLFLFLSLPLSFFFLLFSRNATLKIIQSLCVYHFDLITIYDTP